MLVLRKNQRISMERLVSLLNVSDRTIRNDIKQVNEDMKECAVIDTYHGEYMLRIYREDLFRKFYSDVMQEEEFLNSPKNRLDYVFGKLMRATEPVLTDELAYEMNVGRTTMVSDLKKLRSWLEEYEIVIAGKTSQGLSLSGSEIAIRRYVMENNFQSVYKDYPMDQEVMEILIRSMKQYPFEKKVRKDLLNFTTLMLDRFLTGHYIGNLTASYYNLTAKQEYQWVDEMMEEISKVLHIEIPVEERLYVFLPVVGMRTPSDAADMQKIELDENVRPLLQEILLKIKTDMNVTIQSGEVSEEFLYHLMFMMNRLRFNVRLNNPILEDIRSKYPLAYKMAEIAAGVVEQATGMTVTEEEKGFLASYFGVFLTKQKLETERPFSVAVVCGTGRVTSRLIQVQLKKILDSSTTVDTFSDEKVSAEILNRYDLILTTVQLPEKYEKPVIKISEIFDERELYYKIEKTRYWDEVEVPLMDNNWFTMTGLLDENKFFYLKGADDYDQAVSEMIQTLVDAGELDEDFGERLTEREKKGTMVFDQSIAIPHSIQYAGTGIVLAIGIPEKPLMKAGHEISLIFLLGLPEKSDDDVFLIRVYDEIMTIASDYNLRLKLSAATSFPEVLRALYLNSGER